MGSELELPQFLDDCGLVIHLRDVKQTTTVK